MLVLHSKQNILLVATTDSASAHKALAEHVATTDSEGGDLYDTESD